MLYVTFSIYSLCANTQVCSYENHTKVGLFVCGLSKGSFQTTIVGRVNWKCIEMLRNNGLGGGGGGKCRFERDIYYTAWNMQHNFQNNSELANYNMVSFIEKHALFIC